MSTESGELLGIDPIELRFPFELNKQISCTLQLTNKTDKQVAFKVKTTSPKKYCVRPNNGMVAPRSKADVVVTMQAQRHVPPDMQCKDKFLVQSAVVAKDVMPKEVTGDMFTKDSGNIVDEVKLKVVYVAPSSSQSERFEDGNLGSLSYQEETKEPKESEKIITEVNFFCIKLVKLCLLKILVVVLLHLKYSYLRSHQVVASGCHFLKYCTEVDGGNHWSNCITCAHSGICLPVDENHSRFRNRDGLR